jgi:hypothetical protein
MRKKKGLRKMVELGREEGHEEEEGAKGRRHRRRSDVEEASSVKMDYVQKKQCYGRGGGKG